jgi:hypothetical protein
MHIFVFYYNEKTPTNKPPCLHFNASLCVIKPLDDEMIKNELPIRLSTNRNALNEIKNL